MKTIKTLKKCFNINLSIDSYFKINNKFNHAEFNYSQLNNSRFEFDYRKNKVLHFTNIESARLILENNYLRGSNFNQFDDKFEIVNLLNKVNKSLTSNWSEIKSRTFAISFTEKTDIQVQENYKYHWKNYGNEFKGVALEFEFTDLFLPNGFYPLRVNYIDENDLIIKKLKEKIPLNTALEKVEKEFLLPILASIKDKCNYNKENEVRLMFRILDSDIEHLNNSSDSEIFFSFDNNNKIKLELRIPYSTPKNDLNHNILKLNAIYFGKSFLNTEDNLSSSLLMDHFESMCNKKGIKLKY